MIKINKFLFVLLICGLIFISDAYSDETALFFTSVNPDALIVLDLSGSMDWNPAGPDGGIWGDASCNGPFYSSSGTGHTTNCSRLAIAKRAIFSVLDDTNDSTIRSSGSSTDDSSLNIRIGYMSFCGGNDTGEDYSSGNIKLRQSIDTKYSTIFCGSSSSCSSSISDSGSCTNYVYNTRASGGTPLSFSLHEAKLYLNAHKGSDADKACRKKFVILITDGADTYACGGTGSEDQSDMYKRRRETVAKAKALADAGYKVFVVGFGASMPTCLQRTLNWAAYYGGGWKPGSYTGDVTGYNIPAGSLYPSGVTSCQDDASNTQIIRNICGKSTTTDVSGDTVANSNDPATAPLSGYAFLATNADDLATALKQAFSIIREANYSFSVSSVSAARTTDENYLYEASFVPVNNDPFWLGHLKKFQINDDGSISSTPIWDAGTVLSTTSASSRNIKTYKAGALIDFTTANITPSDLGFTPPDDTAANRDAVVGYIRGESAYNPDNWKLGDIFRSNPITIGMPSGYFSDTLDSNNAFAAFRTNHQRTSTNGLRRIVVGANDGQFHVFRTDTGAEVWSFIPPNFLSKLKLITHSTHPTGLSHQYFVDGPVTAADVWLGSGSGTSKSVSDWKTLVVFSEGRGAGSYLWSSSSSCDSGFNSTYSSTYPYFCGYYAFDYTDTSANPIYKWRINPTSSNAPYLGDPWSKMIIGRVKISGNEKWVGFIGGGYNASNCAGGGTCDARGKGFYVVDLNNGDILWSYTRADNIDMNYSIPASPAIADTDNDGFIDTAYVGDLGGNVWRLKFCTKSEITGGTCTNTSQWTGGLLFDARGGGEGARPIYSSPTMAKDTSGNLWIYWATGDKSDPTASSTNEKVVGVKDNNRNATYTLSNLNNVTSAVQQCNSETDNGWYINFTGREKALSDIVVYGGVVYFTTYIPSASGSSVCEQAGTSRLYAINYTNCGGALTGGARSIEVGVGIATGPIISISPAGTTQMSIVTSGGAGLSGGYKGNLPIPPLPSPSGKILYWRDRRLQ